MHATVACGQHVGSTGKCMLKCIRGSMWVPCGMHEENMWAAYDSCEVADYCAFETAVRGLSPELSHLKMHTHCSAAASCNYMACCKICDATRPGS